MRKLNKNEIELVSGGYEDDIIVNGQRVSGGMSSVTSTGYTSTQVVVSGYSYTDGTTPIDPEQFDEPEIVVVAEKMTSEQKYAYDLALSRATAEFSMIKMFGIGGLGYWSSGSAIAAAVASYLGFQLGQKLTPEQEKAMIESMAAMYWLEDGSDGVWDGMTDLDRTGFGAY